MKSFTVTRSKWARGDYRDENGMYTSLVTLKGDMCCLGFGMIQLDKIPKKDLLKLGTPDRYFYLHAKSKKGDSCVLVRKYEDGYGYINNQLAIDAMKINDDKYITDEVRENKLTTRFKIDNIEVKFK